MQSIAIDFDACIHKYSKGWQDGTCYDGPVNGVFEAIRDLMENYTVFIFSTRKPRQIKKWLERVIMEPSFSMGDDPNEYLFPKFGYSAEIIPFWKKFWNKKNVLGITRHKLPAMIYIDDRALSFKGNWSNTIIDIKNFKTYLEK